MKRRHVSYTNELKIEAILGNKKGITPTELSRRLQVPRSTLCHWIRHEKELDDYVNRLLSQRERPPRLPECLLDFHREALRPAVASSDAAASSAHSLVTSDAELLRLARCFDRLLGEQVHPDLEWVRRWRDQFQPQSQQQQQQQPVSADSGVESESPRDDAQSGTAVDPVDWAKRWILRKDALEAIPNFDDLSLRTKRSRIHANQNNHLHQHHHHHHNHHPHHQQNHNGQNNHSSEESSIVGGGVGGGGGGGGSGVKRKYVSYTMEEKQKTIRCIKAGVSQSAVSKVVQVPRTTLRNWIDNESSIAQFVRTFGSADNALSRKRCKSAANPQLDKCVYDYYQAKRRKGVVLSDLSIQQKAQLFSRLLNCTDEQKYSLGWLERWKMRHGVRSLRHSGGGGGGGSGGEIVLLDDAAAISSDCVQRSRALSKCVNGQGEVGAVAAEFSLDPRELEQLVREEMAEDAAKWLDAWLQAEQGSSSSSSAASPSAATVEEDGHQPRSKTVPRPAVMLNDELFVSIMCMDPNSWSMRKGVQVFAEAQALVAELNRNVDIPDKEAEIADLVKDVLELKSKLIERSHADTTLTALHRHPASQPSPQQPVVAKHNGAGLPSAFSQLAASHFSAYSMAAAAAAAVSAAAAAAAAAANNNNNNNASAGSRGETGVDDNASDVSLPPLRPLDFVRYDALDHWADFHDLELACQQCQVERTAIQCTKCKVPLCLSRGRNCFRLFHTEQQQHRSVSAANGADRCEAEADEEEVDDDVEHDDDEDDDDEDDDDDDDEEED